MDVNTEADEAVRTYDRELRQNKDIRAIADRIEKKQSSYPEATKLASLSGTIAGDILIEKVRELYTGKRFTEEEVRPLISSVLRHGHKFITGYIKKVQNAQNEKAGIGLKAIVPTYDVDRENGIVMEIVNWSIENEP